MHNLYSISLSPQSQSEPQRDSVDLDTCPINELDTCPIDGEFEAVFEGVAKADEEREGALHSSSVEEGQNREKGITVPSDALQILGMVSVISVIVTLIFDDLFMYNLFR